MPPANRDSPLDIDGVQLPVRRVEVNPHSPFTENRWPGTIPAVRSLAEHGLDLGPLTVLVGENGSGKSTLVEAIAMAFGMPSGGGSSLALYGTHRGSDEDEPSFEPGESTLWRQLSLKRGIGGSRWGFFLRAETMHGFYSYLGENPSIRDRDPSFHEMSHGESFIQLLDTRFSDDGFYLLDEPESALSFSGCLALVAVLSRLRRSGRAQAVVATHSPIIAAVPGARIIEVGEWGLRQVEWEDLELVQNWRSFLDGPGRFLRHLEPEPDLPDPWS